MILMFGDASCDPETKELTDADGGPVVLRPQALEVLAFLATRPNEIVSREEIFETVWPNIAVTDDSLTQCVTDIRKSLGDTERTILRTAPKKGYQLVCRNHVEAGRRSIASAGWSMYAGLAAVVVLVIAAIVGANLWRGEPPTDVAAEHEPTIVVLPFRDLSPDGSLSVVAYGITEDVMTGLARWKEFQVIDIATASSFEGPVFDIGEVAARTGSDYVVQGSVRWVGGAIRVTAQLVDTATTRNVWVDQFDETSADILALNDGVVRQIEQSLIGNFGVVRTDQVQKSWAKGAVSLDEYETVLRAHTLLNQGTVGAVEEALELIHETQKRHPNSGFLKIKEGWVQKNCTIHRCSYGPFEDASILKLAEDGLADPNLPPAGLRIGLWLLNRLASETGDKAGAILHSAKIAEAYPSDVEGLLWSAMELAFVGAVDESIDQVERAGVLDQRPMPISYLGAAYVYALAGDCVAAAPYFGTKFFDSTSMLAYAGCLAESGEVEKARAVLKELDARFNIREASDLADHLPYLPGYRANLEVQFAKVGWPFTAK